MSTTPRRLAAIDIGTVTTRLLVADVTPSSVSEVERSTDITHLGEGLTASGSLSDAAMDRVVAIVARYAGIMRDLGVESYAAVATSASRDASNAASFSTRLEAAGIVPQIVEGSREAALTFRGATFSLGGECVLVDDIGGGSTELVLGEPGDPVAGRLPLVESARSVDVGSRRLTEMFQRTDPPSRAELDEARGFAVEHLRGYFDGLRSRPRALVSVAGTATSLAAIALELEVYDPARVHGYELSGHVVSDTLEHLASLPLDERRNVVGLHPERASVIVMGALILESVMALAGLDSTLVSEHDILYGILLDTYDGLAGSTAGQLR